MNDLLLKIKVSENPILNSDEVVEGMMNSLMIEYPQIKGYTWERLDEDYIQVLVWGDIATE